MGGGISDLMLTPGSRCSERTSLLPSNSTGRRSAESVSVPDGAASCAKHSQLAGHRWARLPKAPSASHAWVKKGSLALAVTGMISGAVFSQVHAGVTDERIEAANVTDAPTAPGTAILDFSAPGVSSEAGARKAGDGKQRAVGSASAGSVEKLRDGNVAAAGEDDVSKSEASKSDEPRGKHRADTGADTGADSGGAVSSDAPRKSRHRAEETTTATPEEQAPTSNHFSAGAGAAAGGTTASATAEAPTTSAQPSSEATAESPEPTWTRSSTAAPTERAVEPTQTADPTADASETQTTGPTDEPTAEPTDEDTLDIGLRLPLPSLGLP